MATDPFADLRPKKEQVPVGDSILELRTATLDQESELLGAISGLDLGALFGPLSEILGSDATAGTAAGFVKALGANGKTLWAAAQSVLGRQLAPALRNACVALLHTHANAMILANGGVIPSAGSRDSDGVFQCPELKGWLRDNLTLVQSTAILRKAWTLNGYSEALGNLIPLAAPEAPAAEIQDSTS